MSHIKTVKVNILGGHFNTELTFKPKLNLLSGSNGTGKSRLLDFVRSNAPDTNLIITNDGSAVDQNRVAYINPTRNSIKKAVEGLYESLAQQGKSYKTLQNAFRRQFNDDDSVDIPAFEDIFVTTISRQVNTGQITGNDATANTISNFNEQLRIIFDYEITGGWQDEQGPIFKIRKGETELVPTEFSTGEKSILALAFNIFTNTEDFDYFLIDEPEVHLNWSLESKLFRFLKQIAETSNKQLIVATHSPVVFDEEFTHLTTFLEWQGGNVLAASAPSETMKLSIAKLTLKHLVGIDPDVKTFFVEDEMQSLIVHKLAQIKGKEVNVEILKGSGEVLKTANTLANKIENAYFLVDGDNKTQPENNHIIRLKKYCIEGYLVNPGTLANISNKTEQQIRSTIRKLVKELSNRNPRNLPFIQLAKTSKGALSDQTFIKMLDAFDASGLFKGKKNMIKELKIKDNNQFVELYIDSLLSSRRLSSMFKEIITAL